MLIGTCITISCPIHVFFQTRERQRVCGLSLSLTFFLSLSRFLFPSRHPPPFSPSLLLSFSPSLSFSRSFSLYCITFSRSLKLIGARHPMLCPIHAYLCTPCGGYQPPRHFFPVLIQKKSGLPRFCPISSHALRSRSRRASHSPSIPTTAAVVCRRSPGLARS